MIALKAMAVMMATVIKHPFRAYRMYMLHRMRDEAEQANQIAVVRFLDQLIEELTHE